MYEITRTIRFCLNSDGSLADSAPRHNTYAAWPPMRGLGRYYELDITCAGEPDPKTGYFIYTQHIDRAARDDSLPRVSAFAMSGASDLAALLSDIMLGLRNRLGVTVARVSLRLTPTFRITLEAQTMSQILISQMYDLAAAHRLHASALSDEENARTFGKCNNAAGHGHNYRIEITVRTAANASMPAVETLDAIVDRCVVQKLDHKNLNCDVPEFSGVTTTVENIAKVVYELLAPNLKQSELELDTVRVWETDKTVCTYRL